MHGSAGRTPLLEDLLTAWRQAERDLDVIRNVSIEDATIRARAAERAYQAALAERPPVEANPPSAGPPASRTSDEDVMWGYQMDWTP